MADRRMFARSVIDSDLFLDMPLSAQALYFHLGIQGDDDGFVGNPRKIQRMVGASDDDLRLLIVKRFVIVFESGILVLRHWKIHNYIPADRYHPTIYTTEKCMLDIDKSKPYELAATTDTPCIQPVSTSCTPCIQPVSEMDTELGKLGKLGELGEEEHAKAPRKRFAPPTQADVAAFMGEYTSGKSLRVNVAREAEMFLNHYEGNGWKSGRTPLKDWRAAARNWCLRATPTAQPAPRPTAQASPPANYRSLDDLYDRNIDPLPAKRTKL